MVDKMQENWDALKQFVQTVPYKVKDVQYVNSYYLGERIILVLDDEEMQNVDYRTHKDDLTSWYETRTKDVCSLIRKAREDKSLKFTTSFLVTFSSSYNWNPALVGTFV